MGEHLLDGKGANGPKTAVQITWNPSDNTVGVQFDPSVVKNGWAMAKMLLQAGVDVADNHVRLAFAQQVQAAQIQAAQEAAIRQEIDRTKH